MRVKTQLYRNFERKKKNMMKYFMRVIALTLVFIMAVPINPDAAVKKPVFNISGTKNIYVGKTLSINIKNKIAGSKYKWSTSNKNIASVTKNGIVKGLKEGKATITCKITAPKKTYTLKSNVKVIQGAKSIKINDKDKMSSLLIGSTFSMSTIVSPKKVSDKVTYSSSDETIAKVNKNGKITALKVGISKITAKTASGKKDTVAVEVTDKVIVNNKSELTMALSNKKLSEIAINTTDSVEFIISSGTYKNTNLIVNAPNADVVNSGTFKNITISALKPSTWTEKGKGNNFNIKASNTRLVVESGAVVNAIDIGGTMSNSMLTKMEQLKM